MNNIHRHRAYLLTLIMIVLIAAGYSFWNLRRPLAPLKPDVSNVNLHLSSPAGTLDWPSVGQSAVGILNSNILETHGIQTPAPTASTAKMVTALTVLQDKPLSIGDQGPGITLTANDVNIYNQYVAEQGSVVQVQAGETITEYQMLEAMLLPSANNMADSLAIWAYGSLPAYKVAANEYLKQQDINDTTIGDDASGYLPSTTSTAQDLVKIGELAMENPVLAQIVSQSVATNIPVVSSVKNVNQLLGMDGIVGIKTGNTDQAGGVYLSAAHETLNQKQVTIVTALMGAPTLFDAMTYSLPLIQSAEANFNTSVLVRTGSIIGYYRSHNGASLPVMASQDLAINTWNGNQLTATTNLPVISNKSKAGKVVSKLSVYDPITTSKASIPLKLDSSPENPTILQRLLHPSS
jgi:D-alanyl-D-alanine carboxypeptidase (penicillin-binding protein 5/6)